MGWDLSAPDSFALAAGILSFYCILNHLLEICSSHHGSATGLFYNSATCDKTAQLLNLFATTKSLSPYKGYSVAAFSLHGISVTAV